MSLSETATKERKELVVRYCELQLTENYEVLLREKLYREEEEELFLSRFLYSV